MTPIYQPRVSIHAIERFRERIEDVQPQEAIARMLTPKAVALLSMGATKFRLDDGTMLCAREGTVVTVYGPGMSPTIEGARRANNLPQRDKGKKIRRIQAAHKAARGRQT